MDDTRRAEIRTIVDHFKGKAVTQDVINEFCKRNKIEAIVASELGDYVVQVEHDEAMERIHTGILAELQKLRFIPEFASKTQRAEGAKANEEVEINIAKLFEIEGIRYNFVSGASEELARKLHGVVSNAGTRIFNKATSVLMELAKDKFGGEFTTKHSADYWEERYAKHDAKKVEDKKEETDEKA